MRLRRTIYAISWQPTAISYTSSSSCIPCAYLVLIFLILAYSLPAPLPAAILHFGFAIWELPGDLHCIRLCPGGSWLHYWPFHRQLDCARGPLYGLTNPASTSGGLPPRRATRTCDLHFISRGLAYLSNKMIHIRLTKKWNRC